jgi:hypothetical protein
MLLKIKQKLKGDHIADIDLFQSHQCGLDTKLNFSDEPCGFHEHKDCSLHCRQFREEERKLNIPTRKLSFMINKEDTDIIHDKNSLNNTDTTFLPELFQEVNSCRRSSISNRSRSAYAGYLVHDQIHGTTTDRQNHRYLRLCQSSERSTSVFSSRQPRQNQLHPDAMSLDSSSRLSILKYDRKHNRSSDTLMTTHDSNTMSDTLHHHGFMASTKPTIHHPMDISCSNSVRRSASRISSSRHPTPERLSRRFSAKIHLRNIERKFENHQKGILESLSLKKGRGTLGMNSLSFV